jgi:hypothetical protein
MRKRKRRFLRGYQHQGRQTTLHEFLFVTHIYVPMRRQFLERRGLAERELKARLERQGWTVWRGDLIGILRREEEVYPNVRKKYELLAALLAKRRPDLQEELEYLAAIHHGLPDFLCHRLGEFKLVECKLGHEQLSEAQRRCIPKLQAMGFAVEVHKLVETCTKVRAAEVDITTGRKSVRERQLTITKRLAESTT